MRERRKTAIYLRISMEDAHFKATYRGQDESFSIRYQREYLLKYISKDSRLADSEILEFCDDGYTGANMERPAMQELLKQVRQNLIGCILVKDMSRFSRDYIEMGTYLNQIFPFMGVDFIAINDGYDSREHEGATIALDTAFQTLVYDLYSKDLSVKIKTAFDNKCENGEYVFGEIPLGYRKSSKIKNAVEVNEREAEIVRYIFSMAEGGMTSTQIAKKLHEERIPTATQLRYPQRKPLKKYLDWNNGSVRRILDNRFYIGEMAYGKSMRKAVGSKAGIAVPQNDWKVIENHHEPLVSLETFHRVALAHPGHSTKRQKEKHPLIGKIYCGGCGYSLNYKPKITESKPRFFWCRKHALLQIPECCTYFNGAILEETVLMLLNRELMCRGDQIRQRESLEQFHKEIMEKIAGKEKEYQWQYHDLQKEKDFLYESYADRQIDAQEYRSRADQLTKDMKELSDRIQEVEAEHCRIKNEVGRDKQDMKQIIRYAHIETLTQDVVDTFIRKVTVYRDKRVEIEWNFSE